MRNARLQLLFVVVKTTIAVFTTMNDNAMTTFDTIEIRRPALAKNYLNLLIAQPGRPIALFAARRVGKTFFLDHDLTPVASKSGWLPVYADVWLQRISPLDAINHALEEALDDATVPKGRVGKIAKTLVKKVGAGSVSVELGETPKRRALPAAPELRLDTLIARIAQETGKTVLLMLDEIQTLGETDSGDSIIATLRAVLHKRKSQVAAVFTGSSQSGLAKMMATAGAPMYQFTQMLDFPALGDDYLDLLANHFAKVHRGRKLKPDDLRRLFAKLGFKPALMKDLIKNMSAEGITDVDLALKHFINDERQVTGWRALLDSMEPFERAVLIMIAKGQPPMGGETLKLLAGRKGKGPTVTVAKVRAAIARLRKMGVVSRDNGTRVEDQLLAEYLSTL